MRVVCVFDLVVIEIICDTDGMMNYFYDLEFYYDQNNIFYWNVDYFISLIQQFLA